MRRLFTIHEARGAGISDSTLWWGEAHGRWRRVHRGVYAEGPEDPTPLDLARAGVVASAGSARGRLAGVLHALDAVVLPPSPERRRRPLLSPPVVIDGVRCACGLDTLVDLAATLHDDPWEQALESALRHRLTTLADLEALLPRLGAARVAGTARMRRVLTRRGDVRPTESLLETMFVQLARTVPALPAPVRQHEVLDVHGAFVARVDLCWPTLGLVIELDGKHHALQQEHDARRATAIVAATGWLVGRFSWREVATLPRSTAQRLAALVEQAQARPFPATPAR